jgi:hypothetical protein
MFGSVNYLSRSYRPLIIPKEETLVLGVDAVHSRADQVSQFLHPFGAESDRRSVMRGV